MRKACLLHLVLVVMSGTATSFSQTEPEALLCRTDFAIGEIPNVPFSADIVEQLWRVNPDGSRGAAASTARDAGFVARDSHGRVVIRTNYAPDHKTKTGSKDFNGWSLVLCDPRRKSITQAEKPAGGHGFGWTRPDKDSNGKSFLTTATFRGWHNIVPGRDNLGEETYENLPAFRYRIPNPKRYPVRSHDVVISDQLAVQLLHSTWYSDPSVILETRLTNLRLTEPPHKLFDIPPWAWAGSDGFSPSIGPPVIQPGIP